MAFHPDLRQLQFLLGVWTGTGRGHYPTIDAFDYQEEISFSAPPGKPYLAYTQRTARPETGEPLHTEAGYLRPAGPGRLELVLAQPTGIVEVHTGSVEGTHVHLRAALVGTAPTAKEVTDVERHIEVEGSVLRYRVSMAAVGRELQPHLEAELRRRV